MVKLGDLFSNREVSSPEWEKTKNSVMESIDALLEQGSSDKETLLIMKELLSTTKPRMKTYIEE